MKKLPVIIKAEAYVRIYPVTFTFVMVGG